MTSRGRAKHRTDQEPQAEAVTLPARSPRPHAARLRLELANLAPLPIVLWLGMKIGQLAVFEMSGPAEFPYGSAERGSRYQGQRGPTESRSWQNFHRTALPG